MVFWASQSLTALTERGWVPDAVIRAGIRGLLRQRLASLPLGDPEAAEAYRAAFLRDMAAAPVALLPEKANEQHYEVPAEFFQKTLGRRLKYSGCFWPEGTDSLDAAEAAALAATCERAELADGQRVLELGCGWGSLSLWMAEHYPASRIVAVSNSNPQREYIQGQAAQSGLTNLEVITCDMNQFAIDRRFDRVVSVEMFEHMRNWQALFGRVAGWLEPEGRFFMHVFCHKALPYLFEVQDDSDWMSRYFFSGGMMPSFDLPTQVEGPLEWVKGWRWDGTHYEKTANAWLANMDRRKAELWPVLAAAYGADAARMWWSRWRIFFMACAELFGYRQGTEWMVGHYLFQRADSGGSQ
jgi:cyclopropane-fatty-acyl-phospholipid synthase